MSTVLLEPDIPEGQGADLTPPGRPGETLSGLLGRLEADLDALVAFDLAAVDGGELGEGLVASQRLRAKFAAIEADLVGVFDRRRAYRADGSRSTATWLAARSNTPRKVIQGVVRLGRRLRVTPTTRQRLEEGRIAPERADVLTRLATSPRKPVTDAFARDEPELVKAAEDKRFDEFCRDVRYWQDRVDPDDCERQGDKQRDSRRVHLSQSFQGTWFMDGVLDPVSGGELDEALRRIYDELHRADRSKAEAIHGPCCAEELLERTPPQRRADALVELARRATATPHDGRKPRPLISVLVGYEPFRGPIRQTFNGTLLSNGQVAALLTEADIERVVFAPSGRDITDLGRRTRLFTPAQRRVIQLRDRTCGHPDCEEPAERCDMNHWPTPLGPGR